LDVRIGKVSIKVGIGKERGQSAVGVSGDSGEIDVSGSIEHDSDSIIDSSMKCEIHSRVGVPPLVVSGDPKDGRNVDEITGVQISNDDHSLERSSRRVEILRDGINDDIAIGNEDEGGGVESISISRLTRISRSEVRSGRRWRIVRTIVSESGVRIHCRTALNNRVREISIEICIGSKRGQNAIGISTGNCIIDISRCIEHNSNSIIDSGS